MATQMQDHHLLLVALAIGVVVYYNWDFVKQKYTCVKGCYTTSSGNNTLGSSVPTMGASGTTVTPISHFDGSVADAQAQMAATASGLGTSYSYNSTRGMFAVGDQPAGASENELAPYQADTAVNAALSNVISPLSEQEQSASLAWLAANANQAAPSLLPNNVSAEYAALLNNANFLAAGDVQSMVTRPVMRNDGSQSQDFFRFVENSYHVSM